MVPLVMSLFRRVSCFLGRCRRCRLIDLMSGIGGICVDCGRIYGWISREELGRMTREESEPRT